MQNGLPAHRPALRAILIALGAASRSDRFRARDPEKPVQGAKKIARLHSFDQLPGNHMGRDGALWEIAIRW
jgi:hypothetical protein